MLTGNKSLVISFIYLFLHGFLCHKNNTLHSNTQLLKYFIVFQGFFFSPGGNCPISHAP